MAKDYASDEFLTEFYHALNTRNGKKLLQCHIPMSDVIYARAAYEAHSGEKVSVDRMERCMYLEGMLKAHDVFEPNRKRDWED